MRRQTKRAVATAMKLTGSYVAIGHLIGWDLGEPLMAGLFTAVGVCVGAVSYLSLQRPRAMRSLWWYLSPVQARLHKTLLRVGALAGVLLQIAALSLSGYYHDALVISGVVVLAFHWLVSAPSTDELEYMLDGEGRP